MKHKNIAKLVADKHFRETFLIGLGLYVGLFIGYLIGYYNAFQIIFFLIVILIALVQYHKDEKPR